MLVQPGTLIVRPICANLQRDTDYFTKMDPYCLVLCGHQRKQTQVAVGSGKTPNWVDQLIFKIQYEDVLQISVYDYDVFTKDDLVGEGSVSISRLISIPNREDWLQLQYRGRHAGSLRLNISFTPDAFTYQSMPVYTQPAPCPVHSVNYVTPVVYPTAVYQYSSYHPAYPSPSYPQYPSGYTYYY